MDNLKNFQPIHTVKTDKAYSKENTKGVSEKPSHKEISHKFNRSPQQKPGIDCITSAETLPARTKGNRKKKRQNKTWASDFRNSTGWDNRVIYLQTSIIILQEKGRMTPKVNHRWKGCHLHHRPKQGWFQKARPPWFGDRELDATTCVPQEQSNGPVSGNTAAPKSHRGDAAAPVGLEVSVLNPILKP